MALLCVAVRRVLELRGALVRYLRVRASDREAALPRVAAPEGAPSGVLPPPTLLLLRETLYQARLLATALILLDICSKTNLASRRMRVPKIRRHLLFLSETPFFVCFQTKHGLVFAHIRRLSLSPQSGALAAACRTSVMPLRKNGISGSP